MPSVYLPERLGREQQGVMKTVAILQSNYIPWKGYFDMIAAVDEFILFDDM
ncbi:WbqC-like protein family protein [compost metagenome]